MNGIELDKLMKKVKLNKEEAALEKEIKNGEWVLVPDMENETTKIRVQAHNFLNKNKHRPRRPDHPARV